MLRARPVKFRSKFAKRRRNGCQAAFQPYYDEALTYCSSNSLPLTLKFIAYALMSKDTHTGEIVAKYQTISTMTEISDMKDDTICELKERLLKSEAKSRAATGDRTILEAAIYRYGATAASSGKNFNACFDFFCKNVIFDGSGSFSPKSKVYLAELSKFHVDARNEDVKKELKARVKILSRSRHYLSPGSSGCSAGVHVGGDLPLTVALSISMLHLQHLGLSDLDLIVRDVTGLEMCMLTAGAVSALPL